MGIGGIGSLPFRQFAVINGEIVDPAKFRNDNVVLGEQPSNEVIVAPGLRADEMIEPPAFDMSGFGKMDLSAMQAPDGYADMQDYLLDQAEEFSLNELRNGTGLEPQTDKIRLSRTNAYDFLMENAADGADPETWYAQKAEYEIDLTRARFASARASRGKEVDPKDLLVQIGDQKYSLDELDALTDGLVVASKAWEKTRAACQKTVANAWETGNGDATQNWLIDVHKSFALLSLKQSLSKSDVGKEIADHIYQRYQDRVVKNHEKSFETDLKIDAYLGTPRSYWNEPGKNYYYASWSTSLYDKNSFGSDIFWKMSNIDVSSNASFRKDFGEFADWFAEGVEQAFSGSWYQNPKGIAMDYKSSLFFIKDCYGL